MTFNRWQLWRRTAWTLTLCAAAAGASGCTAWKRQKWDAQTILARSNPPDEMRVTLNNGTRTMFKVPLLRSDSLFGLMSYEVERPNEWDLTRWKPGGVALADIREVALKKVDAGKTLLFVAAGIGVTVAIVAIASSKEEPQPGPTPPPSSGGSGDGCYFCSCPLIYSWDGQAWVLDSGTFGGAFLRPLAYADVDNLEAPVAREGEIHLRLQAGDRETDHIDELTILAVDHDPSVTVAADPDGGIHTIGYAAPPIAARDKSGRDALALVTAADGKAWESPLAVRDTARVDEIRDELTLEFARPPGARSARLLLKGQKTAWAGYLMRAFVRAHGSAVTAWYDAMDSNAAGSAAFRRTLEDEVHLNVLVWEGDRWVRQGTVWGGGPEIAKTHAIPLDLARVEGSVVKVRLESAPSFWLVDRAALDTSEEKPFEIHALAMSSGMARDGSDAAASLRARDGRDLVLETGDQVELTFTDPPLRPGMARTYLSRAYGWYRFHAPEVGPPDTELLRRIVQERRGISKTSVAWMNAALLTLGGG